MIRIASLIMVILSLVGCVATPPHGGTTPAPYGEWVTVGEVSFLYRDLTKTWSGGEAGDAISEDAEAVQATSVTPVPQPPAIGVYDIPFPIGEAQLSEESETRLAELLLRMGRADRIAIRGTAGGTDPEAVRLATDRADAVAAYLRNHGIGESLVELEAYEPWIRGRRVIVSLGTGEQLARWEQRRQPDTKPSEVMHGRESGTVQVPILNEDSALAVESTVQGGLE